MATEFPEKLRVFDYRPEVFPPGSPEHAAEPADSQHSLVHYYNFALVQTRYSVVTKLDDDHIALDAPLAEICQRIRARHCRLKAIWCFSGLNLAQRADGSLGVPMADPVSGSGDIGFFTPTEATRFRHDPRFERFDRGGIPREFVGFLYWHMKYLKPDSGFANYDLGQYPESRYHRKKRMFEASEILTLPAFRARIQRQPGIVRRMALRLNAKLRLKAERDHAIAESFPQSSLEDAITDTSPEFASRIIR